TYLTISLPFQVGAYTYILHAPSDMRKPSRQRAELSLDIRTRVRRPAEHRTSVRTEILRHRTKFADTRRTGTPVPKFRYARTVPASNLPAGNITRIMLPA